MWEGIRVHGGRLAFLDRHLDRLWRGAKAIAMDIGLSRADLEGRLYSVLHANGMTDEGAHVRLMVTRGIRSTPYQDPRVVVGAPTVIIIPEWKAPRPETATRMLKLFTVHVRRGYPDVQDPMLNSHSKLNCITACIQAAQAGADEGADARPARLRRHLQLNPFLHRDRGRDMDLKRRLLPRRNHSRRGD